MYAEGLSSGVSDYQAYWMEETCVLYPTRTSPSSWDFIWVLNSGNRGSTWVEEAIMGKGERIFASLSVLSWKKNPPPFKGVLGSSSYRHETESLSDVDLLYWLLLVGGGKECRVRLFNMFIWYIKIPNPKSNKHSFIYSCISKLVKPEEILRKISFFLS